MTDLLYPFKRRMEQIGSKGCHRQLRISPAACGKWRLEDGTVWLNFSSNDYRNLSVHPNVVAAVKKGADLAAGTTASRLMSGDLVPHEALEAELAEWTGFGAALLFGSGFLANAGVVSALVQSQEDQIYADKLVHASLIDGMRLSGGTFRRFRHNDPDHLEHLLQRDAQSAPRGVRLVLIESVYSMDGDLAPVDEIAEIAHRNGALLLVDEAHALGVFGPEGRGCSRRPSTDSGTPGKLPDLMTGTLGKSLGNYGGFCACSPFMRDYLVNCARPFIFSTALPVTVVEGARAALRELRAHPEGGRELLGNAKKFHDTLERAGLSLLPFASQIVPVMIGENARTVALAEALAKRGIHVTGIRPPTVPAGTARLRLSITSAHTPEDLDRAARELVETVKEFEKK